MIESAILEKMSAVYRALWKPAPYFVAVPRENLLRNFLWGALPLLLIAAGLIFFAAAFNADEIRQVGEDFMRARGLSPDQLPFDLQPAPPLYLLTFPLYWFVIILFMATVRVAMLALLGAAGRSLETAIAVTGHGAVAMICVAAVLGLFNQLFPITIESPAGLSRVLFSLGLFLCGWLIEGRLWLAGARQFFELKTAQGVFTWLAPVLAAILLTLAVFILMIILAAGGAV